MWTGQTERLRRAALAVSAVVFLSAVGAAQQPSATATTATTAQSLNAPKAAPAAQAVPTSKDVMVAAAKALLGGDHNAFARPYSYSRTYVTVDGDGPKTVTSVFTCKDRKCHEEGTMSLKKGKKTFNFKMITDWNTGESWEALSKASGDVWQKSRDRISSDVASIRKLDDYVFVSEAPTLVNRDNEECYKVDVKYKDPKFEHWSTAFLINKSDGLILEREDINAKESRHAITVYKDYAKAGSVMVPQKILEYEKRKKDKPPVLDGETTIQDFKFRNDIPDSLFAVPKK
jgi:hypothetical protein